MDDPLRVDGRQPARRLAQDRRRARQGHDPSTPRVGADDGPEVGPFDVLHGEKRRSLVDPERVRLDDVVASDARERGPFPAEERDHLRVPGELGIDHLQSHRPVEPDVLREVHAPHAAAPELTNEHVAPFDGCAHGSIAHAGLEM